jgi:hypothetical protein
MPIIAECANHTFGDRAVPQTTPIPAGLLAEHHAPILALLSDTLLTADQVAARWQQSPQTLANARRSNTSLPFLKLPRSGHVRYRLSDVIAAELAGMRGPITVEVVRLAIMGTPGLSPAVRDAVVARIAELTTAAG